MKRLHKEDKYYISNLSIAINSVLIVLFAILALFIYVMPARLLSFDAIDYYSRNIFPIIALPFNAFSNVFIQSVTEMFAVVGGAFLFVYIIVFIVTCVRRAIKGGIRGFLRYFLKRIRIGLTITIIGVIIFQLMIGINYYRTPAYVELEIDGKGYTAEQYLATLDWAYNGMISARRQLGTDYNGVAHMKTNYETAVYDANGILLGVEDYFDLGLSTNYIRVKPVMLSHAWRYTEIVGFYDALLGEANVNVDYMDVLYFPITLCHETIHAKGYSNETDANMIAVIACVESSRADFRYAGFHYIFNHLYNTAVQYAEHEGLEIPDYLSRPEYKDVIRDEIASDMYEETFADNWFTDFVDMFSEEVNDAYLKSNNQKGGTKTYTVPTNIYVDFFYTYIVEGDL